MQSLMSCICINASSLWAFSDSSTVVPGSAITSACATESFSPRVAPAGSVDVVVVWCEKEHHTKWHMMSF